MSIPLISPHDLVGNKRDIWWNMLEIGRPITLEFVDYFKAPVFRRGRGVYSIYYAIARCNYPALGILVEDEIIMYMSFKCYVNALRQLKSEYKIPCVRKNANGKNLFTRIERTTKERLEIHFQDIRDPTEEQLVEAKKQYKLLHDEQSFHKR